MTIETDVVVVGAGPVGLLLAGDLAAAGVRTTLVERRPQKISNLSRAFGVHARALEQLDARGIAEPILTGGQTIQRLKVLNRFALDVSGLPTRYPHVLIVPQYEVEKVLLKRAQSQGVTLAYETEATGLVQDDDGVTLQVTSPDGPATIRAAYVVGCDGHRSTVRDMIGLPFPGKAVIRSMILADVRLAEPPSGLNVAVRYDAFCFLASFGDGYHRVVGWHYARDVPEDIPLELDEVRETMRTALGSDFGLIDARWTSRFHSDERQVPHYRVGRVFVAGDAAHVHSPAGGQGMNTGLQDAANLCWKIAEVVSGRTSGAAAEALLDSYESERHPVGKMVLRASGALVRAARGRGLQSRLGLLGSMVVRNVAPVRRRMVGMLSGIGITYARPRGAHKLVGQRAPDIALAPGQSGGSVRLYEALRSGGFVLVKGSDDGAVATDGNAAESRYAPGKTQPPSGSHYAKWAQDATVVRRTDNEVTTLLVRPDGYIAWAAS